MSLPDKKSQSWVEWLTSPIRSLLKRVYQPSTLPLIKDEYPKQIVKLRTPGRYSMPPNKILENYAPTQLPTPEFEDQV